MHFIFVIILDLFTCQLHCGSMERSWAILADVFGEYSALQCKYLDVCHCLVIPHSGQFYRILWKAKKGKYFNISPPPPDNDDKTGQENNKRTTPQGPSSNNRKKEICRFYTHGRCKLNSACRFQHPKICPKFSKHGDCKKQGCIGDCEFLHIFCVIFSVSVSHSNK